MIRSLPIVGLILEQFWGLFSAPDLLKKGTKKGTSFGIRSEGVFGGPSRSDSPTMLRARAWEG